MRYKIASDIPGRIRVRTGKYAFDLPESCAIADYLTDLPFVYTVKVSSLSGSVLVTYEKGFRENVLSEIGALNIRALVIPEDTFNNSLSIDNHFKRSMVSIVIWRIVKRLVLPSFIRTIFTIFNSIKFIKAGMNSLLQGKCSVEVLDAAAVTASMLQGNFNTASSIMFLLNISDILEDYTRKKTRSALTESLAIKVDNVWVVDDDGEPVLMPMSNVKVGDKIIIRTGSMIPVDGTVTEGEAMVNQSAMTGEPLAVFKKQGNSVFAGTVVEEGNITIAVRSLSSDSRISQIVGLIDQSESLKASVHSKAERIADSIVPFSFILSGLVMLFTRNVTKAVSVLLVDYSCAIKLSTPILVISAMREAANHKVMVKGGKFLEAISEADTIVFDKTGTLTNASPTVRKVVSFGDNRWQEVLRISACLEEHFPHSVASAVVKKAAEENITHAEMHNDVEYIVAHGIASSIDGSRAIIGSEHFVFDDEKVPFSQEQKELVKQEAMGDSVIYLAVNGKAIGFICISDPPRPEAKEVISNLKALGINYTIMLTGDSETTARVVSEELGFDEYRAQVLPEDKASIVASLKNRGNKVIMVGDGVNDSPALAAANVSIAMKDSSDIAREVADITLLSSDLRELITIRILSQKLMKRISSNFNFIISYNTLLMALGLFGIMTPSVSALLHNLSTMGICALSMRPLLSSGTAYDSKGNKNQDVIKYHERK